MTLSTIQSRMVDMFTGAIEGGSNYWCDKVEFVGVDQLEQIGWGERNWWDVLVSALINDIDFNVRVHFGAEDNDPQTKDFTAKEMWEAIVIMQQEYYRHYRDMIAEEDDAITADVYFQCVVFGEVIYG